MWISIGKYKIGFAFSFVLFHPYFTFDWRYHHRRFFFIMHCARILAKFYAIIDDISAEQFLELLGSCLIGFFCVSESFNMNFCDENWLICLVGSASPSIPLNLHSQCLVLLLSSILCACVFFFVVRKVLFDTYLVRLRCCLSFSDSFSRFRSSLHLRGTLLFYFSYSLSQCKQTFHFSTFVLFLLFLFATHSCLLPFKHSFSACISFKGVYDTSPPKMEFMFCPKKKIT